MEPSPFPFRQARGLKACITAFFAEHPQVAQQSNRVSQITGTDDLWLTPAQAAQFTEWASNQGYLSRHDAQRLITGVRQIVNTIHNQTQHPEGREP